MFICFERKIVTDPFYNRKHIYSRCRTFGGKERDTDKKESLGETKYGIKWYYKINQLQVIYSEEER